MDSTFSPGLHISSDSTLKVDPDVTVQGKNQFWFANGVGVQSHGQNYTFSNTANYSLALDKAIALLNDNSVDLAGMWAL